MAEPDNTLPPQLANRPKCGACKHGIPANEASVACFGGPPSVVLIGAMQSKIVGQPPQMRFENMRPILSNDQPGCSLWAERDEIPMIGETKSRGH